MPPPPPPAAGCSSQSPGWPNAVTNSGWTQTTATTATLQCGWNAQAGAMNVPSTAGSTLSCTNGAWTVQPYGTVAATCVAQGVGRRAQEEEDSVLVELGEMMSAW